MRPGFIAVLVVFLLSGCVGGETGGGGDPMATGEALPNENQAIVRGRVIDQELRAIAGATVAVASLTLVATTDAEGNFALPPLNAGEYEIAAYALGYQAVGRRVTVEAGQNQDLTFTLEILPTAQAFYEVFPYVGFEACQWYFEGAIAHCTLPYTQAYGTLNESGVNPGAYGLPKDLQDNRDRYNFTVRKENTGIVSELQWQASSAAAVYQGLVLACGWYDPLWDECVPPGETHTGMRYQFEVGTSPIRLIWDLDEEQMKYLDQSPWLMSRANVYGSDDIAAGFALEQRIEMWNTVFYGAEPPEDYTAGPPDA